MYCSVQACCFPIMLMLNLLACSLFYVAQNSVLHCFSGVRDFDSLAANTKEKLFTQTRAMKKGLEMEPVSAAEYKDVTGNEVCCCRFVINPHVPHLGASPDWKMRDRSSAPTYGLLESSVQTGETESKTVHTCTTRLMAPML